MSFQIKTPGGCGRTGIINNVHPQYTNIHHFPQEPMLWAAHQLCVKRNDADPNPVNLMIALTIAARWKNAFLCEVCS